jgi:hypothetical protein
VGILLCIATCCWYELVLQAMNIADHPIAYRDLGYGSAFKGDIFQEEETAAARMTNVSYGVLYRGMGYITTATAGVVGWTASYAFVAMTAIDGCLGGPGSLLSAAVWRGPSSFFADLSTGVGIVAVVVICGAVLFGLMTFAHFMCTRNQGPAYRRNAVLQTLKGTAFVGFLAFFALVASTVYSDFHYGWAMTVPGMLARTPFTFMSEVPPPTGLSPLPATLRGLSPSDLASVITALRTAGDRPKTQGEEWADYSLGLPPTTSSAITKSTTLTSTATDSEGEGQQHHLLVDKHSSINRTHHITPAHARQIFASLNVTHVNASAATQIGLKYLPFSWYRPAGGTAVQHLSFTRTILYALNILGPTIAVNPPSTIREFFAAVKPILELRSTVVQASLEDGREDGREVGREDEGEETWHRAKAAAKRLQVLEALDANGTRPMLDDERTKLGDLNRDLAVYADDRAKRQNTRAEVAELLSKKKYLTGEGRTLTLREKVHLRKLQALMATYDSDTTSLLANLGTAEFADGKDKATAAAATAAAAAKKATTEAAEEALKVWQTAEQYAATLLDKLNKAKAARTSMRTEIQHLLVGGVDNDPLPPPEAVTYSKQVAMGKYKAMLEEEREADAAEAAARTAAEDAGAHAATFEENMISLCVTYFGWTNLATLCVRTRRIWQYVVGWTSTVPALEDVIAGVAAVTGTVAWALASVCHSGFTVVRSIIGGLVAHLCCTHGRFEGLQSVLCCILAAIIAGVAVLCCIGTFPFSPLRGAAARCRRRVSRWKCIRCCSGRSWCKSKRQKELEAAEARRVGNRLVELNRRIKGGERNRRRQEDAMLRNKRVRERKNVGRNAGKARGGGRHVGGR